MKKSVPVLITLLLAISFVSEAQYYYYGRPRMRVRVHHQPPPRMNQNYAKRPPFQPTLNFSIGYGFPNLDKDQFANFLDAYRGTATQKGPITGAVDYQFSRNMSIGVMGTYGKVTAPYYDYNSNSPFPAFTGSYLRTAIGINNWTQSYLDPDGNKAAELPDLTQLAYQVSLVQELIYQKERDFLWKPVMENIF